MSRLREAKRRAGTTWFAARRRVGDHAPLSCIRSLALTLASATVLAMATISDVEKLAFDLPESDRALLAAHLLRSLPSILLDEDEGMAEALRRDAELDADPSIGVTLEELDDRIRNRR